MLEGQQLARHDADLGPVAPDVTTHQGEQLLRTVAATSGLCPLNEARDGLGELTALLLVGAHESRP